MPALIRDAPAGVVLRLVFGAKAFPYNDEKPGFQPPRSKAPSEKAVVEDVESSDNATKTDGEKPDSASSGSDEVQVVEWYGADDPDNPQNWSTAKKSFVLFLICLLTFAVYSGSAIVTPAQPAFVEMFGVSKQVSSLTLSLYVLGYGLGPLLFSPLSEVPRLGRNIPYMVSLTLFILITVAAARVDNYPGFVVLRFLQGFLGGPVLATGGASAGDVLGFHKIPYGLTVWLCAAYAGPALGPLLSAYAVTGSSWRWTMYELLILCGSVFLVCLFALPETNADTILLHRARRLRKQTGNLKLQSQSEVKQGNMHLFEVMARHLTTPFRITVQDPSIAFINIYTALFYGIYVSSR
jgi:MFS transporter, DHA1 family, multidrug resistance protein